MSTAPPPRPIHPLLHTGVTTFLRPFPPEEPKADHLSANESWASIAETAEIVVPAARNRDEFIAECRSGALDGVRAAYRTFYSAEVTGLIDEELVKELPESLRFVCHNGASPPLTSLFCHLTPPVPSSPSYEIRAQTA